MLVFIRYIKSCKSCLFVIFILNFYFFAFFVYKLKNFYIFATDLICICPIQTVSNKE